MRTKYFKSSVLLASVFILLGSITNASAIRPDNGSAKQAPGKTNPKAIAIDDGAARVAPNKSKAKTKSKSKTQFKSKGKSSYTKGSKTKTDPRKGIIEPIITR